jgi:hypothetical protein
MVDRQPSSRRPAQPPRGGGSGAKPTRQQQRRDQDEEDQAERPPATLDIWQKGGGKADLVALYDPTLEALAEAIGQLRL